MSTVNTVRPLTAPIAPNCPEWRALPRTQCQHPLSCFSGGASQMDLRFVLSSCLQLTSCSISSCPWMDLALVHPLACVQTLLQVPDSVDHADMLQGCTLVGEGTACVAVIPNSWLILLWSAAPLTLLPDNHDKNLWKLQQDTFWISTKKNFSTVTCS